MKRFLLLIIIFLSACEIAPSGTVDPSDTVSPSDTVTESPSPTVTLGANPTATDAKETYRVGEPVTFMVDEMVYFCRYFNDQVPYSILQVIETSERRVAFRHSCTGYIGQGVDEYCEDGEIRTEAVEVGKCSDDVLCDAVAIQETFTWDQQEYVRVTEACAGETIQREVKQQVPEGEYQIVVERQTDDGEIVTRVVKEFVIIK